MRGWTIVMLTAGASFAAGTVIAASRIPRWRKMAVRDFIPDFGRTIAVADKVQPALAVIALVGTLRFAFGVDASSRTAAVGSAVGLIAVLAASAAVLVPLQRRIIAVGEDDESIEVMRDRWVRGHVKRAALAVASFALAVVATLL